MKVVLKLNKKERAKLRKFGIKPSRVVRALKGVIPKLEKKLKKKSKRKAKRKKRL